MGRAPGQSRSWPGCGDEEEEEEEGYVCVYAQGSARGGERSCSVEEWMDGAGLVASCSPPPPVLSALRSLI